MGSLGAIKKLLEDKLGVFVHSIATGSGEYGDVWSSFFGNVNDQVRMQWPPTLRPLTSESTALQQLHRPQCMPASAHAAAAHCCPRRPAAPPPAARQVDKVCRELADIDELAGGFNMVGFSQGGQFLRVSCTTMRSLRPACCRCCWREGACTRAACML